MLYENVKYFCSRAGISIRSLEQKAGLGNGVINGWKNSNPRIDSLKSVAKVLGVTLDELLEERK